MYSLEKSLELFSNFWKHFLSLIQTFFFSWHILIYHSVDIVSIHLVCFICLLNAVSFHLVFTNEGVKNLGRWEISKYTTNEPPATTTITFLYKCWWFYVLAFRYHFIYLDVHYIDLIWFLSVCVRQKLIQASLSKFSRKQEMVPNGIDAVFPQKSFPSHLALNYICTGSRS